MSNCCVASIQCPVGRLGRLMFLFCWSSVSSPPLLISSSTSSFLPVSCYSHSDTALHVSQPVWCFLSSLFTSSFLVPCYRCFYQHPFLLPTTVTTLLRSQERPIRSVDCSSKAWCCDFTLLCYFSIPKAIFFKHSFSPNAALPPQKQLYFSNTAFSL